MKLWSVVDIQKSLPAQLIGQVILAANLLQSASFSGNKKAVTVVAVSAHEPLARPADAHNTGVLIHHSLNKLEP
jgi:hypothetical protein